MVFYTAPLLGGLALPARKRGHVMLRSHPADSDG